MRTADGHELSLYECARTVECITRYGYLDYLPNLPTNIFFTAFFSLFFLLHLFLGLHRRIYSYMLAVLMGVALECIGYGGRIGMYYDVFAEKNFVLYLCGLTIGPAFFSAAVYLCIGRILRVYDTPTAVEGKEKGLTYLKPKSITLLFICCDTVSLILQAVGGGLASAAKGEVARQKGVNVMIAGLSAQVVATTLFCCVCGHLIWSVKRGHPERVNTETTGYRRTTRFRMLLGGVAVATVTILIRCVFRVAELSKGFKSKLANDETQFIVWDSTMMAICIIALSIAHPGLTLGQDRWKAGGMRHPVWRSEKSHGRQARQQDGFAAELAAPEDGIVVSDEKAPDGAATVHDSEVESAGSVSAMSLKDGLKIPDHERADTEAGKRKGLLSKIRTT